MFHIQLCLIEPFFTLGWTQWNRQWAQCWLKFKRAKRSPPSTLKHSNVNSRKISNRVNVDGSIDCRFSSWIKKHLGPLHSSLPLCYVHTAMGNFRLVFIVSLILVLPFKPLVSTKSVFTVYLADYLTLDKISSWTFLFY